MHSIYLNQFGIVLNSTYIIRSFFPEFVFFPLSAIKKEVIYFTKSPLHISIFLLEQYLYLLMFLQSPTDLQH